MSKIEDNTSWSLYYWIVIIFFIISIGGIFLSNHFSTFMLTSKHAVEAKQFSQQTIKFYQEKNYQALLPYYSQSLNEGNETKVTDFLNTAFPSDSPTSVKLIGLGYYENLSGKQIEKISATLEYQFDKHWFLANVAYIKNASEKSLIGIHLTSIPAALEQINKVSLLHASFKQYVAFLLFILLPILVLWALLKCVRTQGLKRKWIWILFIIFGFCSFQFNWTTQGLIFHPISFYLFGVSYFRSSIYTPLVMSFSIPVGAILFLIKNLSCKNSQL